jgi:hypothetical protein
MADAGRARCRQGGGRRRPVPRRDQVGADSLPLSLYGQVAETILTLSTFSLGEAVAAVEAAPLADLSTVPVISTLCPTCGLSFASSASRRYSLTIAPAAEPAVPAVPAVPAAPAPALDAFFSTNLVVSLAAVEPAVPVAPADGSAFWMQPLTVMLLPEAAPLCAVEGSWAAATATVPQKIDANTPDHTRLLIRASCLQFGD